MSKNRGQGPSCTDGEHTASLSSPKLETGVTGMVKVSSKLGRHDLAGVGITVARYWSEVLIRSCRQISVSITSSHGTVRGKLFELAAALGG